MSNHIVLADPSGRFLEGQEIQSSEVAMLISQGGSSVPYEPQPVDVGFEGWVKRSFGRGLSDNFDAPFAIYVPSPGVFDLFCQVRVLTDGAPMAGSFCIKTTNNIGMVRSQSIGFSAPVSLQSIPVDPRGMNVLLNGAVQVEACGPVGFAVSGTIRNARVSWVGASLVRRKQNSEG